MSYNESTGPSLAEQHEKEAELHHVRIYPSSGGFHVQHHRRANDPSPERHTFNSASALAKHIKSIASTQSEIDDPKVPSSENVKTTYGRSSESEK